MRKSVRKNLSIQYQNLRGLRTKLNKFSKSLESVDADVICVTETWLNDSFDDSEFLKRNWIIHRRDRVHASVKRGGGCMVMHCGTLNSMRVGEFESDIDLVDDIWIKIELPSGFLYLCTVYITSKQQNFDITKFLDKLGDNMTKLNAEDRILIVGDFNTRVIDWVRQKGLLVASNVMGEKAEYMINSLNLGNLNNTA